MTAAGPWRLGIEIELLAPPGRSRLDLAQHLADAHQGTIRRFLHEDAEPSKVPGMKVFYNLTPGFEVVGPDREMLGRFVDDITLQDDLNRSAAAHPDWYRLVSDDRRLLRLVARHAYPDRPMSEALQPIGKLFGTEPQPFPGGLFRLADPTGAPIAMACPLPGERERPCEAVSPPLEENRESWLRELLGYARELGFTAPKEGAIHLHFDAAQLHSAPTVVNLVRLLLPRRKLLRRLMQTNPACRRLGPWSDAVVQGIRDPAFLEMEWPEARQYLRTLKPNKYRDVNLRNLAVGHPSKDTVEIRILPVHLEPGPILEAARLFEAILLRATYAEPVPEAAEASDSRADLAHLLGLVELEEEAVGSLIAAAYR